MTLRLLLDEHFSPEIARQLRGRGRGVAAARERPALHGLPNREILAIATAEGRTLVTENVADFADLHRQSVLGGDRHAGVVFTSPRSFPRTRRGIGRLVRALDELLANGPLELEGRTWWL